MSMEATTMEQSFEASLGRLLSVTDIDCRRVPVRKVRTIAARLIRDTGNDPSEAQRQLIQRAAMLGALLENAEARLLLGQDVSFGDYLSAISVQKQLLLAIGTRRIPRDVSLLTEYLAKQSRQVGDDIVQVAE
jgi:hypothetical protein